MPSPEEARTVDHIKQMHEDELLAVPGVQGVGIGERKGKPAILVYVERATRRQRRRLPGRLEGVPLFMEESEQFEAF